MRSCLFLQCTAYVCKNVAAEATQFELGPLLPFIATYSLLPGRYKTDDPLPTHTLPRNANALKKFSAKCFVSRTTLPCRERVCYE